MGRAGTGRRAFSAAVALSLAATAGCAATAPSPSPVAPATRPVVGLALSDGGEATATAIRDGAAKAATILGVDLRVKDARGDSTEQARHVRALVRQRVSAVLVDPVSSGVTPAVSAANAAGVPVVTVGRSLRGVAVASHVSSDNVDGGRVAAAYLADALGRTGVVIELTGGDTDVSRERGAGFSQSIVRYPGLRVVARVDAGRDRAEARRAVTALLVRHPRIDGVFAHDDDMVLGALDALRAAGQHKHGVLVGFNGEPAVVAAIDRGEITATIAEQPGEMGWLAVETALDLAQGRPISGDATVELALVTR